MQRQSLKSLAKIVTLGLVLSTTLTATSSVWADETHVKDDADPANTVFTYDNDKQTLLWGKNASVGSDRSIALGAGATNGAVIREESKDSVAIGSRTVIARDSYNATAIGHGSRAAGVGSFAAAGGMTGEWDGDACNSGANYAVAIGCFARATDAPVTTQVGDHEYETVTQFAVGGGTSTLYSSGETTTTTYYARITGVADGVNDHDAATYGQLTSMGQELNSQIDRMGTRIDKVGAGAAALAAMHPVYDEDSKLTFSAGLGAYRGEQAAAVGMFYRFTDRVMMNAGATVGNNDNMYNVGLNFALDRNVGSKLPSKAVMAKQLTAQNEKIEVLTAENQGMKNKMAEQDAKIAKLMAMLEELKNK